MRMPDHTLTSALGGGQFRDMKRIPDHCLPGILDGRADEKVKARIRRY
jgi:hypothetical protein